MIKIVGILAVMSVVMSFAQVNAFTVISNRGKLAVWRNGLVTYALHSSVPEAFRSAMNASFQSWEDVNGLSLSISSNGITGVAAADGDNQNTVMWTTSGWSALSFRPPSNALAVTLLSFDSSDGAIIDADIYFNAQTFSWGTNGSPVLMDVQNIATHEVGHLLGLDHSSESFIENDPELLDATMYYASVSGETERRDLASDDILGIQKLYSADIPAAPSVTNFEQLSDDGVEVELKVYGSGFSDRTSFVLSPRGGGSDRVARYRTIESSAVAVVTLDLSSLSGTADLIAFNHPTAMSSVAIDVSGMTLSATSAGGGGCQMTAAGAPREFSWVTFYFVLLSSLSLYLARRRLRPRDF
jgi:hypothetical protein